MGSPQSHETQPQQPQGDADQKDTDLASKSQTESHSTQLPAPPKPEDDTGIVPSIKSPAADGDEELVPGHVNIFTMQPVSALRLLCRSIDLLVQMTGDVPPTPPIRSRAQSPVRASSGNNDRKNSVACAPRTDSLSFNRPSHDQIDGVPFKRTPIGSPEAGLAEPVKPETEDVGFNAQPTFIQHALLARKFYSKRPPPISTEEYLLRMHKYCPMSTAVYLATSHYITRLAVIEKMVPVTPRNVHRLLLAGLRVAMKALEDLSWPHSRFAKVGGVSEAELGKLEITFCFLMDFALKVDEAMLKTEAEALCQVYQENESAILENPDDERARRLELRLPEWRTRQTPTPTRTPEKRKASSALPSRPAIHVGNSGGIIEVMGQS